MSQSGQSSAAAEWAEEAQKTHQLIQIMLTVFVASAALCMCLTAACWYYSVSSSSGEARREASRRGVVISPKLAWASRPGFPASLIESGVPPCVICMEALEAGKSGCVLPCGHTFHVDCINGWIRSRAKSNCPTCREDYSDHPACMAISAAGTVEDASPPPTWRELVTRRREELRCGLALVSFRLLFAGLQSALSPSPPRQSSHRNFTQDPLSQVSTDAPAAAAQHGAAIGRPSSDESSQATAV
eukprot:TRINITY_DN39354_c0_g1_i1.p1 TRINITY_DN39354_c0_g1~~TRINITY_DN39354_c0_g1_i1.p1  ORF type:complete len:244 (-),score=41.22 TRINITY_DN39354_c0_g1_i1:167-898(-)